MVCARKLGPRAASMIAVASQADQRAKDKQNSLSRPSRSIVGCKFTFLLFDRAALSQSPEQNAVAFFYREREHFAFVIGLAFAN